MKLCFIAHAGKKIGFGHLMRCITLAEVFEEKAHTLFFISRVSEGIKVLKDKKIKVLCIHNDKEIGEILSIHKPDCVIVDSYNINNIFFGMIKRYTRKVVYIDDLYAFEYQVDCIINGTASAFQMDYKRIDGRKLLLGMNYNLLRKEFRSISPITINPELKDILITTGGGDPEHMTEKIITALLTLSKCLPELKMHAVIGGAFTGSKRLEELGKEKGVMLYTSPESIVDIMLKCDIAICAGGSTLYELMACGIPILAFLYADNQMMQTHVLEQNGSLINLGSFRTLNEEAIIKGVLEMQNLEERKKMSNTSIESLDRNGALKCVQEIINL